MAQPVTVVLLLVGGTIVAAAAARRVREERGDALRREPFVGLAELARRIQARRGGFGSAVTGIDLRQPFDDSFFGGGGFGGGPLAGAPVAGGGDGDSGAVAGAVAFLSPGGPSDTTTDTATFGLPANTAPQDFNEAQFAAQQVSQTAPGVRAAVAAFSLNPIGVIAAVVDAMIDGVTGGRRAPGSASPTVSAIVSGARAVSGAITAVTGLPGVGAPGAVPGLSAVPGLAGVPGLSAAVGAMVQLSLFIARRGVEVEAGRRAAADPGFRAAVAAEVARQRADPARFFNVLADPKAFPDAPRGLPTTTAPEVTFAAPRASDPIDAPAAPTGGAPGAPGGLGEPGGAPGGAPGGVPGDAPSGPPGGVPGGTGTVGGLAAQGEGPGFTAGFTGGELSLGLSPAAPAPAPSPTTSEPDPGLVSEPADPDTSGGGGTGAGGGGVGAGGGGDSGPGGEGP